MEPENINEEVVKEKQTSPLHQVTPLSKYLAMVLFIVLPFVGGYVGYMYALEKVVEMEKEGLREVEADNIVETVEVIETEPDDLSALENASYQTRIINQGEYTLYVTAKMISVYVNGSRNSVQQIEWRPYDFPGFSGDLISYLITGRDVNYDHYMDIGVLQAVGSGSDLYYGFYTFDPEQRKLVRENTLGDGFETEGMTIVNPVFDIENKTVSTCQMGPVALKQYRCKEFVFNGDEYVKGKEWTESWD